MNTCQQELMRQGKPYPRTCAVCFLGPCTDNSVNSIPDNELLARAVRNARSNRRKKVARWTIIMDQFALGSTYAQQLCRRYGAEPDELV